MPGSFPGYFPGYFPRYGHVRARTSECSPWPGSRGIDYQSISRAACVISSPKFTRQYHRENPLMWEIIHIHANSYLCKYLRKFQLLFNILFGRKFSEMMLGVILRFWSDSVPLNS